MPDSERQEPGGADRAAAAAHRPFETDLQVAPDLAVASLTGLFDGLAAEQALAQGRRCLRQLDLQFLHLGALLSTIRREKWHRPSNFRDYAAQSLGLKKSRAAALLRVFETSARFGLNAADVAGIGWTKMQIAVPHLTPDNLEGVLVMARQQSRHELTQSLGPRRPRRRAGPPVDDTESIELDDAGNAQLQRALSLARGLHSVTTDAAALVIVCSAFSRFAPLAAGLRERQPAHVHRLLDAAADVYGRHNCVRHLSRVSPAARGNVHPGGQTGPPGARKDSAQ
jgi:hypothetical protein